MGEVSNLRKRILFAKRRAKREGRLDDPDFLDWLDEVEGQIEEETRRRQFIYSEQIELGKGQFGC